MFKLFLAEMIPELIVPDLYDCKLKPYVSYKTKEINQEELTSRYFTSHKCFWREMPIKVVMKQFDFRDLFNVIYGNKIVQDFKEGKLDREGNPLEPSPVEQLSSEEVCLRIAHLTFYFWREVSTLTNFPGSATVSANWFRHFQRRH